MTGSPLSGSNQRIGGNPVSTKSSCVSIVVPNEDGRSDKGQKLHVALLMPYGVYYGSSLSTPSLHRTHWKWRRSEPWQFLRR